MAGWRQKGGSDEDRKKGATPPAGRSRAEPPAAEPAPVKGKAGWRKSGASAGMEGQKSRSWLNRPDQSYQVSVWRRRIRNSLWGLMLLGLIGTFVYILLLRPRTLPVFTLVVTDYDDLQIPHNLAARFDLQSLQDADARNDNISVQLSNANGRLDREKLRIFFTEGLRNSLLMPGGPGKDAVVIYISTHGVLNGKGEPCLLLSDSSPLDSGTWYPVKELLKEIQTHVTTGKGFGVSLEKSAKTLLVLDCSQIRSDWSLGVLANGFVERLSPILKEVNDPNIAVLCSAGDGQRAWTAPELAGSAFGQHFVRALDGAANLNHDGRITLDELASTLADDVSGWVRTRRDEAQRPVLITSPGFASDSVPLAFSTSTAPAAREPQDRVAAWQNRAQDLASLWDRLETLAAGAPWRRSPVPWAGIQFRALRLEELLLDGAASEREFTALLSEVDALINQLGRRPTIHGFSATFPLAMRFELTSDPIIPETELASLHKYWSGAPKPFVVVPDKSPPLPKDSLAASYAVWSWLADPARDAVTRPQLQAAIALLGGSKGAKPGSGSVGQPVEIAFLKYLEAQVDFEGASPGVPQAVARAILTRKEVEDLAAPRDERIFPWVAPLLETIDERRRRAEDHLFVGSPQALVVAGDAWTELRGDGAVPGLLADLQTASSQVAAALELRDRALNHLPALSQWVIERLRHPSTVDRPALSLADLTRLAQAVQQLAARLDDIPGLEELASARSDLQNRQTQVTSLYNKLEVDFFKHCEYLRNVAAPDAETLREIRAVLQCPTVTGTVRNKLRKNYLDIVARGQDDAGVGKRGDGQDTAPDDADAEQNEEVLKELCALEAHPALAAVDHRKFFFHPDPELPLRKPLLTRDETGRREEIHQQRLEYLALLGDDLRKQLAKQDAELLRLTRKTQVPFTNRAVDDTGDLRRGLSEADRLTRMQLPFRAGARPRDEQNQAQHDLQMFDRVFLLFRQAQRALHDFWGPLPGSESARPDDWYCLRASDELVRMATSLLKARNWPTRIPERLVKLKDARAAAAIVLQMPSKQVAFAPEAATARFELSLSSVGDLPAGTVAAFVLNLDGTPQTIPAAPVNSGGPDASGAGVVRRQGVPGGSGGPPVRLAYDLSRDKIAALAPGVTIPCAVGVLYRGHRTRAEFVTEQLKPEAFFEFVAPRPRVDPPPSVSVTGSAKPITELMLIFDSSFSMQTKIKAEVIERTRMDVAREAINEIVGRLPAADYQVGLMLYGHRAGFLIKTKDGKQTSERRWRPGVATRLDPALDVELVLGIKANTDDHQQDVIDTMKGLEPWGVTPLYLALTEALRSFGPPNEARPRNRHIVVVTDGVNSQEGLMTGFTNRQDVEKLRETADFKDIKIDIVGIDMPREEINPDNKTIIVGGTKAEFDAVGDLRLIAMASGGEFFPANDQSALLEALDRSVLKPAFSVSLTEPETTTVPLGTPWKVRGFDGRKHSAVVSVHQVDRKGMPLKTFASIDDVTLEGGEALVMNYRGANRLEFLPFYDNEISRRTKLMVGDPANVDSQFEVGLYRPDLELPGTGSEGYVFRISVQNRNLTRFTPRPAMVWAEIRPKLPNNATLRGPPLYFFCDRDFQPDKPVPVLQCHAPVWPRPAVEAGVQFGFRFDKVMPNWENSLDQALLPDAMSNIEGFSQTKFTAELIAARGNAPFQIKIREEGPGYARSGPANVELFPAADRVRRRFFYETGRVVEHLFEIDQPEQAITQARTVRITASDRIKDGALSISPTELTVSKDN